MRKDLAARVGTQRVAVYESMVSSVLLTFAEREKEKGMETNYSLVLLQGRQNKRKMNFSP